MPICCWLVVLLAGCGRLGFDDSARQATLCGPTEGLLVYYSFDAGELTSEVAIDRSGHHRDGQRIGGEIVGGRIGDAISFELAPGKILTPELPFVPQTNAATVSLWLFRDKIDPDEAAFYLPATDLAEPPRYDLWLTTMFGAVPSLCINTGDGNCWGATDQNLIGRWVHAVAVFANGPINGGQLYIDGVARASCVAGDCTIVRQVLNPVTFGAVEDRYNWRGGLDDVRVYDRALTQQEAGELFACTQQ